VDNIYYGAVPPNSETRPVLLFVHGLGGLASDWWLRHDMYETAYNAGYRTAFVTINTNGQRGPGNNQWVNGIILAFQIHAVTQQLGVPTVDIVAHSKGGVDAQTAIVYYGAHQRVRNVFTIASPHHGTQLADLPLANWLLALLEQFGIGNDDALRSVRTDSMQAYRAATDPIAANQSVRYYTGAGHGGKPTAYLTQFGPNDGLVTVASTLLPGATDLGSLPYTHFQLMDGSKTFNWVRSVLEAPPARPASR
jgi:triacylglycerol lipase